MFDVPKICTRRNGDELTINIKTHRLWKANDGGAQREGRSSNLRHSQTRFRGWLVRNSATEYLLPNRSYIICYATLFRKSVIKSLSPYLSTCVWRLRENPAFVSRVNSITIIVCNCFLTRAIVQIKRIKETFNAKVKRLKILKKKSSLKKVFLLVLRLKNVRQDNFSIDERKCTIVRVTIITKTRRRVLLDMMRFFALSERECK